MKSASKKRAPSIVNLTVNRRYLTEREVERLMNRARKHSRHGHRDATMILVAYRHACEPRRSATCNGSRPSYPKAACTFTGSRTAFPACIRSVATRCGRCASYAASTLRMPTSSFPSAADQSVLLASTGLCSASGRPPRCHSRSTHTCFAMPVGSSSPTMATTHGLSSTTSDTKTSSTRSDTPKWRRTASRIFGANWRRQARDRLPLYQLRALRLGLHRCLDVLDHGLKLLVRQLLERIAVLDLVLARHQQSEDLEIGGRLRPAHFRNSLFPVL